MKFLLAPPPVPGRFSLALFLGRALLGAAMVVHGWGKVQHLTTWAGEGSDALPAWMQAFAALGEFFGGALLALGLLTPVAALWLVGVMAGAVQYHLDKGDDWIAAPGEASYELALAYLVFALLFLLTGPGALSLDQQFFGRKPVAMPAPPPMQ